MYYYIANKPSVHATIPDIHRSSLIFRNLLRVHDTVIVVPVPSQIVQQVAVGRVHDPPLHQLQNLHDILLGREDDMLVRLHHLPLAHFVAHDHDVSSEKTEVRHSAEKRQVLEKINDTLRTSAKPRQKWMNLQRG